MNSFMSRLCDRFTACYIKVKNISDLKGKEVVVGRRLCCCRCCCITDK